VLPRHDVPPRKDVLPGKWRRHFSIVSEENNSKPQSAGCEYLKSDATSPYTRE
jgi:hypothetical protein